MRSTLNKSCCQYSVDNTHKISFAPKINGICVTQKKKLIIINVENPDPVALKHAGKSFGPIIRPQFNYSRCIVENDRYIKICHWNNAVMATNAFGFNVYLNWPVYKES